jgi:hypothetical protein
MCVPELMVLARKHWEEWLPEKVAELRAQGALTLALNAAANLAQDEIDHLMRNCGYQEHEAREVALRQFILLPPEPTADDDELEEELREKERQYQMNLPAEVLTPEELFPDPAERSALIKAGLIWAHRRETT